MVDREWWIVRVFLREVHLCRCPGHYCGHGKNNPKKIQAGLKISNNGCWGRSSTEDTRRSVIHGTVLSGTCYREIPIWLRHFILN